MPRINLLPWREQQRVERKKAFGVGLGIAFVAALVVTGVGYLLFSQMIEAQQNRNATLRSEIKELDKQIEQINDLEQKKEQALSRMRIIEKLQRSRPEIVHVFDTFVKTIPDGTYLTRITQTDQKFKVEGIAQSPTRVSSFMRTLDDSEYLKETEVEVVEAADKQRSSTSSNTTAGHDFTLYMKQRALADNEPAAGKGANDKRKKP